MAETPSQILLVDDEADFVEMLSLRLKEIGESVLSAFSGGECLKILAKTDIDVVILDVKMPGMNGVETLAEIKKAHPLVEVIMLTGHGTIETALEGMKLGAYDLLIKPADFHELIEKLNNARRRKQEQLERIRNAQAALQ
ncbi:MAG: response regulator [Desulfobacterales bacterium]|jgi:DNA-binding NtrC family response regulator|nr:response regulator [Desulfobacterales bacterium]